MKKVSIDSDNIDRSLIKETAEMIRRGGIAALPTETVYGLATRADKKESVAKLYALKHRPKDKPFSYAVSSAAKATDEYFSTLPPFGYRLMEKFWPGPITIVYYDSGNKKIGARVPAHRVTSEVLRVADLPVYLPSANINGEKEATTAEEVEAAFGDKVDLIVDGGSASLAKSSTVIDLTYRPYRILREGAVPEREIIDTFIKKRIVFVCTGNTCRSPMAEYLLKKYLEGENPYIKDRYEIISRGLTFIEGGKAATNTIDLLREEEGLDAGDFSSRRLKRQMILSADYLFTMEDDQLDHLLRIEPSAMGRAFNLKKFLPPELEADIPDPMGKSKEVYRRVYDLIKEAVLELREWL